MTRSAVGGPKLVLAVLLWLGGGTQAEAARVAGGQAARLSGAHAEGGAAPMLLAKAKKKRRRHGPAGHKKNEDSGAQSSTEVETADAPPAESAPPASAKSDDGPAATERASSNDESDERPASSAQKKKSKPAKEEEDSAEADVSAKGEVKSEAKADEAGSEGGPSSGLEVGLGGMALFRHLNYTADGSAQGLGPYSLAPGPEAGLWVEAYPAAFVTTSFAANIGVFGRYARGFGATSDLPGGGSASTVYQDFLGGLKVRIPLTSFAPFGTVAYGKQAFLLNGAGAALVPAVDYAFIRVGAGTRVKLASQISLDLGAAFLSVTGAGSSARQLASADFFPQAKAAGVDVDATLAVRLTSNVGIRGGVDFRQYGLAFHPSGTSRAVTGGTDRYVVTFVGLEVTLDGMGGGEASAGSDEEKGTDGQRQQDVEPRKSSSSAKAASSKDEDDEEEEN